MVAIADRLSAAEREDNLQQRIDVSRTPLQSILASIQGIRDVSVDCKLSYKKLCFNPFKDSFPVEKPEEAIAEGDYDYWWHRFVEEIERVLVKESTDNKSFIKFTV